jgi:hypothetical protein
MLFYLASQDKNLTFLPNKYHHMEGNPFYYWDDHNKVWASDLDRRDQTEWFVWDPHTWWEYNSALMRGEEWFPRAEICRSTRPPSPEQLRPDRKRVALLFYEHIHRNNFRAAEGPIQDHPNLIKDLHLGWADLIVTYTTEPMNTWWPVAYGEITQAVHSDRIKCCFAAQGDFTNPPSDRFFCDHLSWFHRVVQGNQYHDINQVNTPFRKYMFDCLMGTVRTSRLWLMYRLMESGWIDEVVVNLQPRPNDGVSILIDQTDPTGLAQHGRIENYASSGLRDLEETDVIDFKHRAGDDATERYSVKLMSRRQDQMQFVPGHNISMSNAVPWGIYQASWYSIITETYDRGDSVAFLTEKTAKCLFAKRIFVMVNGGGLLARLRELGFRTFHGRYVDESYDNEPDDVRRWQMAWEQIVRLRHTEPREVYAHYQEILEHNHRVIMDLPQQQLAQIRNFLRAPFF